MKIPQLDLEALIERGYLERHHRDRYLLADYSRWCEANQAAQIQFIRGGKLRASVDYDLIFDRGELSECVIGALGDLIRNVAIRSGGYRRNKTLYTISPVCGFTGNLYLEDAILVVQAVVEVVRGCAQPWPERSAA